MKNQLTKNKPYSLAMNVVRRIKNAWATYQRLVHLTYNGYRMYEENEPALCCANNNSMATKYNRRTKEVVTFDDQSSTY